ncbi:MAG TPA: SAM-dependent chlorinase/fluorinase [Candidatus Binataceae bacterium]|jgi:S-adenosyl-L-methionine hydrolase (adenosine-forming)|nr:SAM-dependent chlorinase/fluorinase [Candidatus Binataceae bacterium]
MAARATNRGGGAAPIAILTDFGYRDHYVGAMKGVIASIAPGAPLIDVTHGVPAQSIAAGAIALAQTWRLFPPRTVFLVVVDPGVGTARLAVAVQTRAGARFVGPDNGVLSLALEEAGPSRAVELRAPRYRRARVSATFHGRDIFAPAAAHLWRGVKLESLGPPVREGLTHLELAEPREGVEELRGEVLYVDGFGNLVSNIARDALARFEARFPAMRLSVRIGTGAPIEILQAYGDARNGVPLATFGSFELLEIAVREGSAARHFAAGPGAMVTVRPLRRKTVMSRRQ